MDIIIHVWRQQGPSGTGKFDRHQLKGISPNMSFLEMLDVLNEQLIAKGQEAVAFDSDCREGICGMCGCMVNGIAHGPDEGTTLCQLHMRSFRDGDELYVEPFRAHAFPVVRDLVVDRAALDRIIASGGYISVPTGSAPEANNIPVPKPDQEAAMDAAACIGCGACVGACPNASASLFTAAKVSHLGHLPQGQPERHQRAQSMVGQMDKEGFGNCTFIRECEAACPKEISVAYIARMNRDFLCSVLVARPKSGKGDGGA
jgi:succinate dehydrogenase / fumarate reductase iron-sulfur subunit